MLKSLFITMAFLAYTFFPTLSVHAGQDEILLVRLQGSVLVASGKNGSWEPAKKWMQIPKEAKIRTLPGSSMDLLLDKGAIIRIKGGSELLIKDMLKSLEKALSEACPRACHRNGCRKGIVIKLFKGEAFFYVSPRFSGLPLLVDTPIGIAGVTGTRFAVDLTVQDQLFIAVFQGHVVVWQRGKPKKSVVVGPKFITSLSRGKIPKQPETMSKKTRKRYEECLKLHLGLDANQALTETSGRYKGTFSRGYSPEVLSEFGPTRIYQYQYTGGTTYQAPNTQSPTGTTTQHHTDIKNKSSSSRMDKTNMDHHDMTDHHDVMDHHDMTDRHNMSDHSGMSDHSMMDRHNMSDHSTMTDHSGMDRSTMHDRPSMRDTSSPHSTMPSTHGGSTHMQPTTGPSTSAPSMGGHKR